MTNRYPPRGAQPTSTALMPINKAAMQVAEAAGFNEAQVAVMQQTIAKNCTVVEIGIFAQYCRKTGLDPFSRQIYAIKRGQQMTIQVSITPNGRMSLPVEIRKRLGVGDDRTPGDYQRIGLLTLDSRKRHSAEVEHFQDVGRDKLESQAETKNVELPEGMSGFEAPQGNPRPPQFARQIGVGSEAALREQVRPVIHDLVQDPQPQVAHADLIQVGIAKAPLQGYFGPFLGHRVPLAAGISPGLANAAQQPLHAQWRHGRRGVERPVLVLGRRAAIM